MYQCDIGQPHLVPVQHAHEMHPLAQSCQAKTEHNIAQQQGMLMQQAYIF